MHKTYTSKELSEMAVPKHLMAKNIMKLKDFDMALPQDWLNQFVETTGLDYSLVLSTCFTCYDNKGVFGTIISCCAEVQAAIDSY